MTSLERAAALIVLILPAAVAIATGAWRVFLWAIDRHDKAQNGSGRIAQGQVIPQPAVDAWATRAYEGLRRELDDEREDHAHTIDRHRACHDVMRGAGLHVPEDH